MTKQLVRESKATVTAQDNEVTVTTLLHLPKLLLIGLLAVCLVSCIREHVFPALDTVTTTAAPTLTRVPDEA